MQVVSEKWKENQKQNIVPESFLEILYEIADFESIDQDSALSEFQEYYSNVSQIVDGKSKDFQGYATLELHNWILDGSRKHLPEKTDGAVYGDVGYISNKLSNGYYRFEEKPVVEIRFSQIQTKELPAITITWSKTFDEYATDFNVSFYKDQALLKTQKVFNSELETVIKANVNDYNKILIEIERWCLPYHRARIEEIFIGIRNRYTKKDVLKFELRNEVDLISGKLPKTSLSLSVENLNNKYNEEGLYRYIFQKQRIDVKFGYKTSDKIEWISGGEYFLSNWEVELGGISANFKATSLLEFLNNKYYKGVFERKSLYQLATEVLEHTNLPLKDGKKRWKIDDSLKSIYTDNPLPIATEKECLQIIANAGKCILYTDRDGFIRIEPISFIKSDTEYDYSVDDFNSYTFPKYTYIPVLKEINSYYKTYFESKSEEIYKATVSVTGQQDFWINYNRHAKSVNAVVSGATLVSAEYYANACKLVLNATGTVNATVTITGKEMRTSESMILVSVNAEGESQDLKNPLISNSERAVDVANWVKSYLTNRKNAEVQWRYDPRADIKDRVSQIYDNNINEMILSSLIVSYNGGFKAIGKGRILNGLA